MDATVLVPVRRATTDDARSPPATPFATGGPPKPNNRFSNRRTKRAYVQWQGRDGRATNGRVGWGRIGTAAPKADVSNDEEVI